MVAAKLAAKKSTSSRGADLQALAGTLAGNEGILSAARSLGSEVGAQHPGRGSGNDTSHSQERNKTRIAVLLSTPPGERSEEEVAELASLLRNPVTGVLYFVETKLTDDQMFELCQRISYQHFQRQFDRVCERGEVGDLFWMYVRMYVGGCGPRSFLVATSRHWHSLTLLLQLCRFLPFLSAYSEFFPAAFT